MSTPQHPGPPGPPAAGGPASTASAARPARPDASMSLLREAAERSLDPGYALAAAERAARREAGQPEPRGPRRAAVHGALALVLGLAGAGAVADLRRPAPPEDREDLMLQIEDRRTQADAAQAEADQLRAAIDARQATALGEEGDAVVERTEQLGVLAATLPVAGPGLRIVLDDAPGARDAGVGDDPRAAEESVDGLVIDRDLQVVANGLFASGAEAVTINGQRLTALASIRVAGRAILVGFTPLSPPYVVEALGDPTDVAGRFSASSAGLYLETLRSQYGMQVASTAHERLELDGGSTEVLRYARVSPRGGADGGTVDAVSGEAVSAGAGVRGADGGGDDR